MNLAANATDGELNTIGRAGLGRLQHGVRNGGCYARFPDASTATADFIHVRLGHQAGRMLPADRIVGT